jgi:hypothetical protein
LVERTSNYTMLLHLPNGYTPELVRDALVAKIKTLPETLRASLTWDQGPEMRDWKQAPAAAQRRGGTTLTPTSGNPPSGGEEGPEPQTRNPASAAQKATRTSFNHRGTIAASPVLRPPAESAVPPTGWLGRCARIAACPDGRSAHAVCGVADGMIRIELA